MLRSIDLEISVCVCVPLVITGIPLNCYVFFFSRG